MSGIVEMMAEAITGPRDRHQSASPGVRFDSGSNLLVNRPDRLIDRVDLRRERFERHAHGLRRDDLAFLVDSFG